MSRRYKPICASLGRYTKALISTIIIGFLLFDICLRRKFDTSLVEFLVGFTILVVLLFSFQNFLFS